MRRFFPALLLVAALAIIAPLLLLDTDRDSGPGAAQQAGAPGTTGADGSDPDDLPQRPADSDPRTWQTSDRVIGPTAAPLTARAARRSTPVQRFRRKIAPGVWASAYDERTPRGRTRYYVMTAKWTDPRVGLTLGHPGQVAATAPMRYQVRMTPHGIGGVNGDFFDIGDTGAALGVGAKNGEVINGRKWGWNAAFYIDRTGTPQIDILPITASIEGRPDINVTNVNSPQVMPNGIGVYTYRWGLSSGDRWTDGQRRNIRMLRIVRNRVVEERHVYPAGQPFEGRMLIARGAKQAKQLRAYDVGDRLKLTWGFDESIAPQTAITGNQIVLKNNKVLATDDSELHPRTAVGIDRRRNRIILLVVEGRQRFSVGYTMVDIARKLKQLGARAGLNLDGGGSSTMIGWRRDTWRVMNSPSDGGQRNVANGLVVTWKDSPTGQDTKGQDTKGQQNGGEKRGR